MVTFVDITERKNRELSLEQSRDYYYRMFENFPSLIWKTDLEGNVVYFNRSWSLFTGKRNEDYLGVKWLDLIHPEDRKSYLDMKNQAFRSKIFISIEFVMPAVSIAGLKGFTVHLLKWMAVMVVISGLELISPIEKVWKKDDC